MHIASNLFWAAQEDDDAELAAATAEHANELGQYALYLLQAAPTLRTDAASVEKMEVLLTSLEKSYAEAKVAMEQAVAAIERLNQGQPSQEAAPQTTDQTIPATVQAIGSAHESNVVGGNTIRVGHNVRILAGSGGRIHSISDDGVMLRVIVSVFGRDTVLDLDVTDVNAET
jgi:transcription antitermination factor NusG